MKRVYIMLLFLVSCGNALEEKKAELEQKRMELEQKRQAMENRMKREEDSLRRLTNQGKENGFVVVINHPEQLENYLDVGSQCKAEGTWVHSLVYVIGDPELRLALRLKNGEIIMVSYIRGACANCAEYTLDNTGNKVKDIIIYDNQQQPIQLNKKFTVFGKISSSGTIDASRVEQ
jgi:hypothetical protein